MTWWRSAGPPAVLCAAGLVETWLAYGADPGRLMLVVVLTAPLVWRRSQPALGMLVISAGFLVQVVAESVRVVDGTFTCYFALLWATYSCARHAGSPVMSAASMAGPLAGGLTIGLIDQSLVSAILAATIVTGSIGVGHAVRVRVTTRQTLERQALEIATATAVAASWHARQSREQIAAEVQVTLTQRVRQMIELAGRAALERRTDPQAAAQRLCIVEAEGRSALQDMRITLGMLRGADASDPGPGCQAEEVAHAGPAAASSHRPWTFILGLGLAATAVVLFNLAAGFTAVADYAFPLALVALAALGVRAMQRQGEILARVRHQTVQLQALREDAARAAVVEEKTRLARELHDVVAHHLVVMVVQAGAARRALEKGRPGSAESLTAVASTGAEVLNELQSLLDLVDPGAAAGPAHGMSELELLVDRARAGGLDVELSVLGHRRSLPGGVDLVAHRIVQESLTNVIRHAEATCVQVVITYDPDRVTIEVKDDGRGLREGTALGLGTRGMEERAQMYGGSCELSELPAGGARVLATLPLGPEAALG
ncbi:sensor histidine kinase [Ornithinimicrobium ciconiae]|uniref:histidine kinase n=1 Tax=Ornithinimicrobium ciconiae TaxID=2594265 RepID=A0A516GDI5_9MICO|nr:sensor histidine kinase [Ornithinimicrobium ciconiae]QDO89567.1 sensor histidine kinase [Ornithinimicrobium ciconiae]